MSTNASIVYDQINTNSYTRVNNPNSDAYNNAKLTLEFWKCTGVDCTTLDFVVENDLSAVLTNDGSFVLNS